MAWRSRPDAPDVDLLVVGEVDPDAVWSMAARLSRELTIGVNPVMRTHQESADDTSGFAETVREGPLLDVRRVQASTEQR